MATEKQIVANRRNGLRSIGPKTSEGKSKLRWNALKHGVLAKSVVAPPYSVSVGGADLQGRDYWPTEDETEFRRLSRALCQELQPHGVLEGMLVEQLACLCWRLRRVYSWEAGKIAEQRAMLVPTVSASTEEPLFKTDEYYDKQFMKELVDAKRKALDLTKDGSMTPEKLEELKKLFSLTISKKIGDTEVSRLSLKAEAVQEILDQATQDLDALRKEFMIHVSVYDSLQADKAARRQHIMELREQTACLPDLGVLEKVTRYEAHLNKQFSKVLHELIRLQVARAGKDVPLPTAVDVNVDGELGSFGKNHDGGGLRAAL